MTDRFEVERALRSSGLSPIARHLARTLLFRADAGTAKVPAKYSASLAVLAHDTGLAKSSVRRGLIELEAAGWLTRDRDLARAWSEKLPTGYRFHIPTRATDGLVPQSDMSEGRTSPTVSTRLGPQRTSTRATAGTGPEQARTLPEHSLSRPLYESFSAAVPGGVERERYESLISELQGRPTVGSPVAVIKAAIKDGTAVDLIKEIEADLAASNGHPQLPSAGQLDEIHHAPPCPHGMPGGTDLIPSTGLPRCPLCRSEQT